MALYQHNSFIFSDLKKLLADLVAIKSVFPQEQELGEYIVSFFAKKKYQPILQKVENSRYNILLEKGKGDKSIILYSHLDTVAVANGWWTNPFKLKIVKDKAFGLGVWDMKGAMTVNILTFLHFQPKNFKLKIVFCVDEENISKGAYRLISSDFFKDAQCLISPEPAFQYGLRGIVIGRIGRAVYQLQLNAPSKHSAFYSPGFDLNFFLVDFLKRLKKINRGVSSEKKQFIYVRKITSEAIGMSLPQELFLELNAATIPPANNLTILKKLKKIALQLNNRFNNYFKIKVNLAQRETPFLESYEINQNNFYLNLLKKSIGEILKKKAKPYFRNSVADDNVFAGKKITVLGVGPEGDCAHAPNEWVSLNSLVRLYQILNKFLCQVDNSIQ